MRRVWFGLAALSVTVGVAFGAAVWFGVAIDAGPLRPVPPGEAVTVSMPERGAILWTSVDGARVSCEVAGGSTPEQGLSSAFLPVQELWTRADGATWHAAVLFNAYPPGDYAVTCTSEETSMAAGEAPLIRDYGTRIYALLAAALLTGAGLALAAVVARRRRPAAWGPGRLE